MAIFGRRRAASNPPRRPPSIDPAAASAAATSAFTRTPASPGNPQLSMAAAAAALRSHTSSPVPVAHIQTKRMQRRGSNSSMGSSVPGFLERRGSNGSMSERTFRSPSPGRRQASVSNARATPPVPPIPTSVSQTGPSHRRAASLDTAGRIPYGQTRQGGRGVSLERGPLITSPAPVTGVVRLSKIQELQREDSRSSINFSRPMSPGPSVQQQPQSPRSRQQPPQAKMSPQPKASPQPKQLQSTPIKGFGAELRPKSPSGIFAGATVNPNIEPRQQKLKKTPKNIAINPAASPPEAHVSMAEEKRRLRAASEGSHLHAANAVETGLIGTAVQQPTQSPKPASADPVRAAVLANQPAPARPVGITYEDAPVQEKKLGAPFAPNSGRKLDKESPSARAGAVVAAKPNGNIVKPRSGSIDEGTQVNFRSFTPVGNIKGIGRETSISPSRRTHFSDRAVNLEGGQKHLPVRSTSPVKSAMKHSPSSSVRGESPAARSVTGDDASQSGRRKGSLRVSFDEAPSTVVLPTGLVTSRHAPQAADAAVSRALQYDDYDNDVSFKPTPTLPKFGSVRAKREGEAGVQRQQGAEDTPRHSAGSMSTSLSTLVDEEPSKDQVVGGILAQDFAAKHVQLPAAVPLAPIVLSKEASHDLSEQSSLAEEAMDDSNATLKASQSSALSAKHGPTGAAVSHSLAPVPDIALLPPTPNADEKTEDEVVSAAALKNQPSTAAEPLIDPAAVGRSETPTKQAEDPAQVIAERVVTAPLMDDTEPHTPTNAAALAPVPGGDTETEDDDSVYSDAAEDLSELEADDIDGTFKSLDAIVESPSPGQVKKQQTQSAAEWGEATAYWRGLSEQRRLEMEAKQQTINEKVGTATSKHAVKQTKPPKKKTPVPQDESAVVALPRSVTPQSTPKPALKSALKQPKPQKNATDLPTMRRTMRGAQVHLDQEEPVEQHRLPTSLRGQKPNQKPASRVEEDTSEHHMPTSLRGPKPKPQPRRTRELSPQGEQTALAASQHAPNDARSTLRKRGTAAPATSMAPARIEQPITKPVLQRSNSSDSVSSFKRKRRSKPAVGTDGQFSFRRSMRAPAEPVSPRPMSPVGGTRSSRFSIRSLSPTPSDRHMTRGSLRGSSKEPKARSGSIASKLPFGRKKTRSEAGSVAGSDVGSPPPLYRSRYAAESDSEPEEPQEISHTRRHFQSRFADSDDDDESVLASPYVAKRMESGPPTPSAEKRLEAGLAPVRGIPRRTADDSDVSTDLEGESDGERRNMRTNEPRSRIVVPPVPASEDIDAAHGSYHPSRAGNALAAGSMRTTQPAAPTAVPQEKPDNRRTNGLMSSIHAIRSQEQLPSTIPTRPAQKRRLSSYLGFGSRNASKASLVPQDFSSAPSPDGKTRREKLVRRFTPTGIPTVNSRDTDSQLGMTGAISASRAGTQVTEPHPADEWPLAVPRSRTDQNDRPSTSDGSTALRSSMRRPDAFKRRSMSDEIFGPSPAARIPSQEDIPEEDEEEGQERHVGFEAGVAGGEGKEGRDGGGRHHYGRDGKKKKFMGLRRVFGLRD